MENIATLINGTSLEELKEFMQGFENKLSDLKTHFTPKEPDQFLSRKETADLLKISLVSIHQWSKDGILRPYKMGNRTYFSRKEIEETLFNSNKE
jgi:predicted DNA-binding transcriptional regulator AlpA